MSKIISKKEFGQTKIGEIFITVKFDLLFTCSWCEDSSHSDFKELLKHLERYHEILSLYEDEQEFVNEATESNNETSYCGATTALLESVQQVHYTKEEPDSETEEFVYEHSVMTEKVNTSTVEAELKRFDLIDEHGINLKQAQSKFTQRKEFVEENVISENRLNTENVRGIPFSCVQCCKTFKRDSSLKRHLETIHGDKRYACEFCGRTFSRKDNLAYHSKMATLNGKCINKLSPKTPLELVRHEEDHSRSEKTAPSRDFYGQIKFNSEKDNYSCSICYWECSTFVDMLRHMKTHVNEEMSKTTE